MPYPYSSLPVGLTDGTASATNHAGYHNSAHGALNDLLTELGTNPSGSVADLTTRLSTMESNIATLQASVSSLQAEDPIKIVTSSTRPVTGLFEGLLIWETDTNRLYVYDGSNWKFIYHTAREDAIEVIFTTGTTAATTSGTMTDWLSPGNITVPTWAVRARVSTSITGIYDVTSANNTYGLRAVIGTDNGGQINEQGKGVGLRFGITWQSSITLTSTGTKAFKIQAARLGGANNWTSDGSCHVTAKIEFIP